MHSLKTKKWQIDNIDTILFDKDGTFVDLHYFWGQMTIMRANAIAKKYLLDEASVLKICNFLGYNPETSLMVPDGITALYSRSKIIEILRSDLKIFGLELTNSDLEKIFDDVSLEFYKDISKYTKIITSAVDFIKKAYSANFSLGIVTSDSVVSTNLTLEQYKLDNYFKAVIGRESHPDTKESGMPTKLALEKIGANPKNVVMIGDAPMDYISAKNAGIESTILVSTGQIAQSELDKISDYTCSSLGELEIIHY